MTLINSTSLTPFFAAIEAKSIVSHRHGGREIPAHRIPRLLAYWDLLRPFASFDHASYPVRCWRFESALLMFWYQLPRNGILRT
jgi:hypothetical protein